MLWAWAAKHADGACEKESEPLAHKFQGSQSVASTTLFLCGARLPMVLQLWPGRPNNAMPHGKVSAPWQHTTSHVFKQQLSAEEGRAVLQNLRAVL